MENSLLKEPCKFLPWDSNFFGLRIAQVEANLLDKNLVVQVNDWCKQNNIDCLYFLAEPEYKVTTRIAEMNQFHLVGVRITMQHQNLLSREAEKNLPNLSIRKYQPSDLPELREISRTSFTRTRFYSDPCFPREKCDDLYDVWIKNSCEGYANEVLVADLNGNPVGFVTCHVRDNQHEGDIGLVAVKEQERGKGIGKRLVQESLSYFHRRGVASIFITMQGSNIIAHRLSERVGFMMSSVRLWYHKWTKDCQPDNLVSGDQNWNP